MADAKLTIKVGADVKKAAEELKSLGYNIQDVKKQTEKANESASLWSQTLKKGSEDSIKGLVSLGAKFLTVTTVMTAAYKGVKELVSEGMKVNEEAAAKIDKINGVWTEIKQNLGSALLDTISPALDTLYDKLVDISTWASGIATDATLSKIYRGKSDMTLASLSTDSLKSWSDEYAKGMTKEGSYTAARFAHDINPNSSMWDEIYYMVVAELEKRAEKAAAAESVGKSTSTGATTTATEKTIWDQVGSYSSSYVTKKQIDEYDALLDAIQEYKDGLGDLFKENSPDARFLDEAKEKIEALKAAAQETGSVWAEAADTIKSSITDCFSAGMDLLDAYYNLQIKQIENSEASEEEKAARINEIEQKQFIANQLNSAAEMAISYAEGVMNVWKTWGESPAVAGTLTGILSATYATQLGTMLTQQYTSSLAAGGIVSQPTHALIGEGAEKEAVMPLSKLEEFVSRPESSGTIVLNITVNGSGNGTAEDVYRAIERAQRTGVLPAWRYVS